MEKIHLLKDMNYQISIKTKIGFISIFSDGEAITNLEFDKKVNDNPDELLLKAKILIQKYLEGKNVNFENIKIRTSNKKFYEYIKKIPYGKTLSYNDIAEHFNIHPRKVGFLLSKNKIPIIIPCHRVIYKNGKLGGFGAGKKWKEFLLKIEGNNII